MYSYVQCDASGANAQVKQYYVDTCCLVYNVNAVASLFSNVVA